MDAALLKIQKPVDGRIAGNCKEIRYFKSLPRQPQGIGTEDGYCGFPHQATSTIGFLNE